MKRVTAIILVLLLLVSPALLAGGAAESESGEGAESAEMSSDSEETAKWEFDKYDPPITLSIMGVENNAEYAPGDEFGATVFDEWLMDELGIDVEFEWVAPNNAQNLQKLNLALASGDLPDSGLIPGAEIKRLADEGAIIPLDSYYDEYLSPLSQFLLEEHNDFLDGHLYDAVTVDGQRYAIPQTSDPWGRMSHSTFIRKDILDELGMDVPQTLEQFEAVLAATKEMYPEMTGISLSKDMLDTARPGSTGLHIAMEPFGAVPMRWVERDDRLVYGSVQPEVKEGLAVLRDWYADGYIDPEFIVLDRRKEMENYAAGNVLAAHWEWFFVHNPGRFLLQNVESAEITAVPPLEGPDGTRTNMLTNPLQFAMFISASAEHPEAYFHYLNREADSVHRDDEELRAIVSGPEYGYEWRYPYMEQQTWEADPAVPLHERTFEYPEEHQGPRHFFNTYLHHKSMYAALLGISDRRPGTSLRLWQKMMNVPREEWDLETRNGAQVYISRGILPAHLSNVKMWLEMNDQDVYEQTKYYGGPMPTMVEKGAYLSKIEQETFAKIIMGEPLSLFDEFVENWMDGGGADITAEVNAWREGLQ
jgi:putative aldouronate transport system substrate-binding protein